ncbi:conserved hypothetical protein [Pediculus humanus corporis]|uniref:Anosmin-1 n=1 Tax=Pediculus humanus subsp. corporis TaxID=121224 RepID=E0W1X0_PEDHC|nr:uncharacterized protein Phum_PHUM580230 [Pediculus humanus corporis]EEB19564.1 conserved hypothetical protein [Pediculus humanus corporis]
MSFQCFKGCLKEPFDKFGYCPDSFDNIPVFVQACVFFCTDDRDCPSTEKCCLHSCGQTCKPALGLFNEIHLPSVPYNLTVKEKKRKNGVHLSWEFDSLNKNQTILFVLEERHHLGRFYNEPLLGEWNPIYSSKKNFVNLKNVIKPGYWYQFRVASVNVNGTKGFSTESEGFKLARRPKLQKPTKLRIEQVKEKNGTIWGTVRWSPSESSIPVQRYKIFWSHRLDERDTNFKSEAVLVQKDLVPENQLHYHLKSLKKNTEYFIQLQALAFYGRNAIKSKMAKMIFKTSKFEDQFEMNDFD